MKLINIRSLLRIGTTLIFFALFVTISCLMVFAYRDHQEDMVMIAQNLRTDGLVLEKEYLGPSRGPDPMHLSLRYTISDVLYERRILVGSETYKLAQVGEPLELYYSASNPFHIFPVSEHAQKELTEDFIARMLIGTGIGILLLILSYFSALKE